jgi:hypothetical protein
MDETMKRPLTPQLFFVILLAWASPSQAEPNVACSYGTPEAWDRISVTYVGAWQIKHHAGYYMAGPMTMPFPDGGAAETMQIEILPDGQLIGTHPEAQAPIHFVWADEPPWSFEADATNDGVPKPLRSSAEVEAQTECGVEDLARLIGRTQVTIDGITMDMTLRLMVVGLREMYGIFHTSAVANGTPVKSWRAVTLTMTR